MLELNEELKNILNEKKGVTGNTAATTDCIVELISDCLAESDPYINKNNTSYPDTSRPSFIKYRNYRTYEERKVNEEKNCIDFIYVFNLPETAIVSQWMDNKTEVIIDCRYYLSAEDLFSDPDHGGAIFSSYKIENGKSVGKLYVIICFTSIVSMKQYCKQNNIQNISYFFCAKEGLHAVSALKPYIQHELNHMHKLSRGWTKKDEEMNTDIMQAMQDPTEAYIKVLAEFIYRYCISTEMQAYTEQFYKEYVDLFKDKFAVRKEMLQTMTSADLDERRKYAYQTRTLKIYKILQGWLEANEKYLYIPEYADKIYNIFKEPACHFLPIKSTITDPVIFCKTLIYHIKKEMQQFYNRCIKTTFIPTTAADSRPSLREQIEEYRACHFLL